MVLNLNKILIFLELALYALFKNILFKLKTFKKLLYKKNLFRSKISKNLRCNKKFSFFAMQILILKCFFANALSSFLEAEKKEINLKTII